MEAISSKPSRPKAPRTEKFFLTDIPKCKPENWVLYWIVALRQSGRSPKLIGSYQGNTDQVDSFRYHEMLSALAPVVGFPTRPIEDNNFLC